MKCVRIFCISALAALLLLLPVFAASGSGVSVPEPSGTGVVTVALTSAASGDTVTGFAVPDEGSDLATVRVTTGDTYVFAELTETENGYAFTFTMPEGEPQVIACFFSTTVWDGAVDISWYDPAADSYEVSTPAQLAGLAALVNGMTDADTPDYMIKGDASLIQTTLYENQILVGAGGGNVYNNLYVSATDFSYKTVTLTADLDMGSVYTESTDTWSGPNWTPIGGRYSMDTDEAEGDSLVIEAWFNGVFDGGGHTIENLYCWRYSDKGFPYSQGVGLFGYLGGCDDDLGVLTDTFEDGWQPTVLNVVLGDGYIYGRRMVGGIVGRSGDASNGVLIECCANYATIKSTDAKGVGGIIACGWSSGAIRYCYNAGDISTVFSAPAGGVCASNDGMDIYNCYNVGTIDTGGEQLGRGIGGHDMGAYSVVSCYYLNGSDDDSDGGGWYTGSSTKITVDVTCLTAEEMQTEGFATLLNADGNAFAVDTSDLNGGYPVLYFQTGADYPACTVTYAETEGGTVSGELTGDVTYGSILRLTAVAEAGWKLDHYTVNGEAIGSDFYLVDGDVTVGAVFTEIREVSVTVGSSDAFSLTVLRTGWKLTDGDLVWVENESINTGDLVLEENVLTVLTSPYDNAVPADMDLEYTDTVTVSAAGATLSGTNTFTVDGTDAVTVSGVRGTRDKLWTNACDTSWFTGDASTYTLTTAEQLAGLSYLVNTEEETFRGVTIQLGCSISLSNTDGTVGARVWKPIGTSVNRAFRGTFDGCGYEITDLTVSNGGSYAALFGCCVNAAIKNVTVRGTVSSSASASYAAGIVAYASGTTIQNCINYAAITAAGTNAGGIAAYICDQTNVEGCYNCGAVSGRSGVGGIVGVGYSGTNTITDCVNFADITASGDSTYGCGGIIGKTAGTLEACRNHGAVSGDRYTGGIAGYTAGKETSALSDCYNAGGVSNESTHKNASLGSIVGYAQYLTMTDCFVSGTVSGDTAYMDDVLGRAGDGITNDGGSVIKAADAPYTETFQHYWPETAESGTSFTVTFMAGGETVAAVSYSLGDTSVEEPEVPYQEGNTGFWAPYTLGRQDITVEAIYRQNVVGGGKTITADGTYYLDYYATGIITVAEGLTVTLDGSLAEHENLALIVGSDVDLTLRDVTITAEDTILRLYGGTLRLEGESLINSIGDGDDNEDTPVKVYGDLTVTGSGTLLVQAGINNAAILVAEGLTFRQEGGTLLVVKPDLLGEEGGALWAWSSQVIISGGVFSGYTNSDNVSVIAAEGVTITGGTVTCLSAMSPTAIDAEEVSITGGSVKIQGHDGNSDKSYIYGAGEVSDQSYYGPDAVNDYAGDNEAIHCSLDEGIACLILQVGWTGEPQSVTVDGRDYAVAGANRSIDADTLDLNEADSALYLYLTEEDHEITVDSVTFKVVWNGGFDVTLADGLVLTAEITETAAEVRWEAEEAQILAALFDETGQMLAFASGMEGLLTLNSPEPIYQIKLSALLNAQMVDKIITMIQFKE